MSDYDRLVRFEAANILIYLRTQFQTSNEPENEFLRQLQHSELEKVAKEARVEELYPEVDDYDLVTEFEIRDCFD